MSYIFPFVSARLVVEVYEFFVLAGGGVFYSWEHDHKSLIFKQTDGKVLDIFQEMMWDLAEL